MVLDLLFFSLKVLGINGYEQLLGVSSGTLAKKVLQLLGQRHNAVATSAIKKDVILIVSIFMKTESKLIPVLLVLQPFHHVLLYLIKNFPPKNIKRDYHLLIWATY